MTTDDVGSQGPPTTSHGPLTVARSLGSVAVGILAGGVLLLAVVGVVNGPASTPDGSLSGLGGLLVGLVVGSVGACLAAALSVRALVRRHERGGTFSAVFSLTLALVLVAHLVGALGQGGASSGVGPGALAWLTLPALWSVPAAAARVVRWRWAVLLALLGTVALTIAGGAAQDRDSAEQEAADASWAGPVLAPSGAPGSPLDGYELHQVLGPGDPLSFWSFTYGKAGDDRRWAYRVFLWDDPGGVSPYLCGVDRSPCPVVGQAQGVDVVQIEAGSEWQLRVPSGHVELQGVLDDAQAVRVLADLREATTEELRALPVVPDPSR
jgi:hypothetical protein